MGDIVQILARFLASENLDPWDVLWHCLWMDGWTDSNKIGYKFLK